MADTNSAVPPEAAARIADVLAKTEAYVDELARQSDEILSTRLRRTAGLSSHGKARDKGSGSSEK